MYRSQTASLNALMGHVGQKEIRKSLERISHQSDCQVTRQSNMDSLTDLNSSQPLALRERIFAHVMKNLQGELELAMENSVSLFDSCTRSIGDDNESSVIDILSANDMVSLLMQNQELLARFFQENVELQYQALSQLRQMDSLDSDDMEEVNRLVGEFSWTGSYSSIPQQRHWGEEWVE